MAFDKLAGLGFHAHQRIARSNPRGRWVGHSPVRNVDIPLPARQPTPTSPREATRDWNHGVFLRREVPMKYWS